MQMFHELIFDEMVPGNAPVQAGFQWGDLLGAPDSLVVTALVTGVSTGGLTLSVICGETPDREVHENTLKAVISAGVLSTTAETVLKGTYSPSDVNFPPTAGVVVVVALNGAGTARVRVWVTGRAQRRVQLRQADTRSPAATLQLVKSLASEPAGSGARLLPADYVDPRSLIS